MVNKGITDKVIKAYALKNALEHKGECRVGSVLNSLFTEGLEKDKVKDVAITVGLVVNEVNKMSSELQEVQFKELEELISHRVIREGLEELPNVKKPGVIMRFAPSPSGALHIGHAITASLSFDYVQKYGGKLYIRIDDTNADNIYPKAHELIKKDVQWLFKKKAIIVNQSDYMKNYYKYAEKLIQKGKAYVCLCKPEDFKENILKNAACDCRKLAEKNIKKIIEMWKQMLDENGYKPGEAVLRFKSDLKNKNPAMRDFPLARINETKHPKVGDKYRVWPLMNFAVAINDLDMGITHAIRAKEHIDNAKRQAMIFEALGKKAKIPWTGFLGRYKFKDIELSASKISQAIKDKKYKGWDDPKLPTVASLKKRGYKPETFWKFAEHRGLSEVDKVISKKDFFKVLDDFNK